MTRFKLGSDESGTYLEDRFSRQKPLRSGLTSPEFLHRIRHAGKRSELILRAVKAKPGLKVLDCTAGLGIDGFLLALAGCEVTLMERSKALGYLLADGIAAARQQEELADAAARLRLIFGDAAEHVGRHGSAYDVIYMDPMFPEKSGSAQVKGDMQLLQRYLGADEDAGHLLDLALHTGVEKVVLKRPPRSMWQPPRTPHHVLSTRNSRYEVYLNAQG